MKKLMIATLAGLMTLGLLAQGAPASTKATAKPAPAKTAHVEHHTKKATKGSTKPAEKKGAAKTGKTKPAPKHVKAKTQKKDAGAAKTNAK